MKKYSNTGVPFYDKHKIESKKYDRIVAKHKAKMSKIGQRHIAWVLLDYSPMVEEKE